MTFTEAISGLNLDASTSLVKDQSFQTIAGSWVVNGTDQLIFTPSETLIDSVYTVTIQLENHFGDNP